MDHPINNFNSIARWYDRLSIAVFGNTLKRSQLCFLQFIPCEAQILIVGGGTGSFLYELLKNISCKKIVYVEASSKMITLAEKKVATISHSSEIHFVHQNIEETILYTQFDVIITHYILDVLPETVIPSVLKKLFTSLKKEGIWLVADFKLNPLSRHYYWQWLFIKTMYLFFKLVANVKNNNLPSIDKYLKSCNLHKMEVKSFYSGMIESIIYRKLVN